MKHTKKVLTIAGSDCSGGAGIQADLKTFAAHGVYGMSAIVSVVAENTSRVIGVQDVSPEMIESQLDAVFQDIGADAVKVGMLSGEAGMAAVARGLVKYGLRNIVIDPVMAASSGRALMDPDALNAYVREIIPLADLLTPNLPEAEAFTGNPIGSIREMEAAAERIATLGAKAVLVKGGHLSGEAVDVLFDGSGFHHFQAERIRTKNTHGTGCTYSSAIASNLALGLPLPEAVGRAKRYVTGAIRHSLSIGKGSGPLHHFYDLYQNGLPKGVLSE